MADNNLSIKFGADATALANAAAGARTAIAGVTAEAQKLASASAASNAGINAQVSSMAHAAGGAHAAGAGVSFWTRELRALGDELSSGRYRQADGTFLNLAVHAVQAGSGFAAANPLLIALGAAAAAAAGAIALVGYEANAAANAVKGMQLDAVEGQFRDSRLPRPPRFARNW